MNLIIGDLFNTPLPDNQRLVYADPPYAGCRAKYARGNGSRQWGRNARADFMRELIARMEGLRAKDGVCAVSMGTPELRLLHMFPTLARVLAWVKPTNSRKPGVWPAFAWEPLVVWGNLPKQSGVPPRDWLHLKPIQPKKGGHEAPKAPEFAQWVIDCCLGAARGPVLELFAGTAPVSRLAHSLGMPATAIDLKDWVNIFD